MAISAGAHSGGRLYPIPELTDAMLQRIQLDDGSADEWFDLAGEPTMSLVDFRLHENIPDPSDLDFRIWLAWHDDHRARHHGRRAAAYPARGSEPHQVNRPPEIQGLRWRH